MDVISRPRVDAGKREQSGMDVANEPVRDMNAIRKLRT